MSQIDEAFIQAYATLQQPTGASGSGQVPLAQVPPMAGLHVGPHIRMPQNPAQPSGPSATQQVAAQQVSTQQVAAQRLATPQGALQHATTQIVASSIQAESPQVQAPSEAGVSYNQVTNQVTQPEVLQPLVETPQTATAWTPEPLPAPHFQPATLQPATLQPTTLQPESLQPESLQPASAYTGASTPTPVPVSCAGLPSSQVAASPTPERRPLSSFSAPEQPTTTAFEPAFEVDSFRWPAITDRLLSEQSELLIPVAEHLLDVCDRGRSLIGVAGTRQNVGCSTLLISLARLVGSVGKSVALVDANFSKASLGADLGIECQAGWESVLTGALPLAECVVKSIDDSMALLPLTNRLTNAHELLEGIHTSVTAGVLRYHYDVVLFNLGAAERSPQSHAAHAIVQGCKLDAGIIIADTDRTGVDPLDTLLSLFGNNCLGVIGNSAA